MNESDGWAVTGYLLILASALWARRIRRRQAHVTVPIASVVTPRFTPAPELRIVTVAMPPEHNPLTPLGYEALCEKIMRDQGWVTTLTSRSGDQGIDVLARKNRTSVVIQCKLYSKPIGNDAVQQALAGKAFSGATHAAVVSNQPYTSSARDLARVTGVYLLSESQLVNADDLFR